MKPHSFFVLIVLALLSLCQIGCEREQTQPPPNNNQSSVIRPDAEVMNARVLLYNRGRVTTEILADKILKFEAKDSTFAYVLNVTSFDTAGIKTSSLISDSGIVREASGKMMAFGHVVAYSEDSTKLETEQLNWDSKADKIQTDAYVRITRPNGDIITGYGLETDQRMNRLKILKQVKGTVQDAGRFNDEISADSANDSVSSSNK
jgi:LPS export ABC transporter protein LptC